MKENKVLTTKTKGKMTNIEFLVNELRKANETIEALRKTNNEVKAENRRLTSKVEQLRLRDIWGIKYPKEKQLSDIDALAALKRKMEQGY